MHWINLFWIAHIVQANLLLTEDFHQNQSVHSFVFTLYNNVNDQITIESRKLVEDLASIYKNEEAIQIHLQSAEKPEGKNIYLEGDLVLDYFPKAAQAVQCLKSKATLPARQRYDGKLELPSLVEYVNRQGKVFFTENGEVSQLGEHIQSHMSDLYHVQKIGENCDTMDGDNFDWKVFYKNYFLPHKPVLIKNSAKDTFKQWKDPSYLQEHFGTQKLHAKLTPEGIFEGCEPLEKWLQGKTVELPEEVEEILQQHFIDVVVVRPATMELTFEDFLEKLQKFRRTGTSTNIYLEYLSMSSLTTLVQEVVDKCFWLQHLPSDTLAHQNLWYGNGQTMGKLHFDPYENFLTQISGRKEFTLYDPYHNEQLYEGHLREAKLEYNEATDEFVRKPSLLLESTSMVNSPIDLRKLNFSRFPEFKHAKQLRCTVQKGDTLYLPSFWWHEVRSQPSTAQDNIAINTWYEPFYTKEFPCASCSLYWNREMYESYVQQFIESNKK